MLISKEKYDSIITDLSDEMGIRKLALFPDYKEFNEIWETFLAVNKNKSTIADKDSDIVQLGYLFTMRWGYASLAVNSKDKFRILFQGLFGSIANTAYSIILLAADGLDNQANILLKNLYELCFTLLNLMIDNEKRHLYLKVQDIGSDYEIWKKYFSFTKLNFTLRKYEYRTKAIDENSILNTWRNDSYYFYCSLARNDFPSLLLSNYASPKNDENILFNLWGNCASRAESIIGGMNMLLWYTETLYKMILEDENPGIGIEEIYKDGNKEFWKLSKFIAAFAKQYCEKISGEKKSRRRK